jgi:uncharacterized delta-60 repeat protein
MNRLSGVLIAAATIASAAAATRNGDLDRNFGDAGVSIVDFGAASTAYGLVVDAGGRIVLAGSADGGPATSDDFAVARLLPDGFPDETFSFDGRTTAVAGPGNTRELPFNAIVQTDGKIVVVGDMYNAVGPGATQDMAIVRFNANGSLDPTFSGDGIAQIDFGLAAQPNDRALDLVQLPDGKLIVAGGAEVTDEATDFAVVKLNADGSRDTSFDGDGRMTIRFDLNPTQRNEIASSVGIDASNRIIVAGIAAKSADDYDFAVARLLPNGQLDTNFGGDGRVTVAFDLAGTLDDELLEMIVLDSGGLFLTGVATDAGYDAAVAKLLPDGSLDTSFGGDGRVTVPFDLGGANTDTFYGATLQPDGKLVLAGFVANAADNTDIALIRLLPDGELDPDFGFAGKSVIPIDIAGDLFDAAVRARYSDGAIIIGGVADIGYQSFMAARVIVDVLFSDGYEED